MTDHLKKLRGQLEGSLRRLDHLADGVLQPNIPTQLRTERGIAAAHNLKGIAQLIRIEFTAAIAAVDAATRQAGG